MKKTNIFRHSFSPGQNRKRLPAGLLAVLLFLFAGGLCPVQARAEENGALKTVRVAVEDSGIFVKADENGKPVSGYAYEYIQSIAAYANWDMDFVFFGSFSDCLQCVADGTADIFYDVSYTEERTEQFLFPASVMGTEEYYIFCLSDNEEIRADDFSTLNGKRIGVTAGTIEGEELQQWSAQQGITPEIVEYESDPAKEAALESGEIDAEYEISMLAKRDFSALVKVSGSDYYMVAGKSRADLIDDINAAHKKILETDRYFLEHLNEKYFSGSVINRTLSGDELAWVAEHQVLKVGYMDNYLPFSATKKDGTPNGIVRDILPLLLESVGLDGRLDVEYAGYSDCGSLYTALKRGEIDVIFPFYSNIEFGVGNGLLVTSDVISLSADLIYLDKYTDETTSTIAVNKSNQLQYYYAKTNYPNARIVFYDTVSDCLKAVKNGKVGCTILNGMRTSALLSREGFSRLNELSLTGSFGFCFAVAEGNSALLSLFNRAIAGTDQGAAFSYALGYLNTAEASSFSQFFRTHKTLLLMIMVIVLAVILAVMTVAAVMLSKARRRLTEANTAKTSFLFNMSHDIRTPMNAIIGFTDMAIANLDDREKLVDNLGKTKEAGNILLSLINSILEMSRIESGKAELDENPGDVRLSFVNISSTMLELAKQKNIDLQFEFCDITDPYVYADFDRCMRVFINIITNAIKYTQSGGWVRVKCAQTGKKDGRGFYRYTFEDNGIGMSKGFQAHLFDEFAREKNSTSSGIQGSGLGMSVVKAFVDLMGGTVECESTQGIGTVFTVTLPLRLQEDIQNAQYIDPITGNRVSVRQKQEVIPETVPVDFTGKRILVVEDNEMNREIVSFILEERGILVEEADDGTTALAVMKEKGPDYFDAILMDIQMPEMNGYAATKAIRQLYPDASLPIIALSANAFAEDRAASLAAGMNDHIAKPINNDELFRTLSNFI